MRVLTQEDTEALLDMESCLEALEPVYVDLAAGAAGSIPRADLVVGHGQRSDAVHGLKTMSGSVPRYQIAAVRVNSDVVHWPEQHGQRRRVKLPLADGRWVGLVLLFDMATGTPLAIFPDGYVQRLRVGATNGLGSKYMAREDASALAVLGSGWQARTQVLACCAVRPIDRVTVYSPTPARREAFARDLSDQTGIRVEAVGSTAEAVAGADIVACATNALGSVVDADCLRPGIHVTSIRAQELAPEIYRRADSIAIHTAIAQPQHVFISAGQAVPDPAAGWRDPALEEFDWARMPTLDQLVAGRVTARRTAADVTVFVNNIGVGMQFAAVGATLLERAEREGRGHELPDSWFTQTVPP